MKLISSCAQSIENHHYHQQLAEKDLEVDAQHHLSKSDVQPQRGGGKGANMQPVKYLAILVLAIVTLASAMYEMDAVKVCWRWPGQSCSKCCNAKGRHIYSDGALCYCD